MSNSRGVPDVAPGRGEEEEIELADRQNPFVVVVAEESVRRTVEDAIYPSYHRNEDDDEGGERNDFIKKPPEESSKEQTPPKAIDEDEIDDYARQLGASSTFFCPVSLELLKDPVVVRTGQTYERSSVEDWIQRGGKTCPATGQPLAEANESIVRMAPNFALRSAIQEWAKRKGT